MEGTAYGNYHIDQVRSRVLTALRAGLEPVVVVHGMNSPSEGCDEPVGINMNNAWSDPGLPEFNRRYAAFLARAVQDLPEVRFWEIWNEADVAHWGNPWGSSSDPGLRGERYASTLKAAYNAIKAEDPNDWVLVTSLTGAESYVSPDNRGPTSWNFLQRMYAAGGGEYYDIMNVHAYSGDPEEAGTTERSPKWIGDTLRAEVESLDGRPGRPIWLTEFGASASEFKLEYNRLPDSTAEIDEYQRDWWYRALTSVIDAPDTPYSKAIGYSIWQNDGDEDLGPGYGYGVMNGPWPSPTNWTPRPAYHTIAASGINAHVFAQPVLNGAVTVYAPDKNPVGYSYTRSGNYVTISGVSVDKLFPTKIPFEDVPLTGGGCTDPSQIICGDNDPW